MTGTSWRRRTSTFKAVTCMEFEAHSKNEALRHHLLDGEAAVPDAARLRPSDSEALQFNVLGGAETQKTEDLRTRLRMPRWGLGGNVLEAQTVNHLLMAFYDALEVHRTWNDLHRNTSISEPNVLMYPQWAQVQDRKVVPIVPLFIEDVLCGVARPAQERRAHCLLIDMDNSNLFENADPQPLPKEFECCMVKPRETAKFIARSVCVRSLFISSVSITAFGMPGLTGDALDRYNAVHGPARYDKYSPEVLGGAKQHGFAPPSPFKHTKFESNIQWVRRPEHDVESIFWSMLFALLLVKPKHGEAAKYASPAFGRIWDPLRSHYIKEDPGEDDCRNVIFDRRASTWADAFDGCMQDVGEMLCTVACQVMTEWALWEGSASAPDHLHEAVQRIILQYLVDHRDDDVALLPGQMRPTNQQLGYHDLMDMKTWYSDEAFKVASNTKRPVISRISPSQKPKDYTSNFSDPSKHPREDNVPPCKRRKK
ncbi:hypothetical protein GSI_09087 [Ganoderma sinense ZZ0214-1]|uniref:Fungal-type protein kinase domain-containing protein n=1 Tax=Ganoderma sinense ZZ0214-1 TaxID=1077348 RepID=A0A2G8S5H7_9APHY|nr:hypothetical protein GSI_09087 [Ganoderma sinense ZZ0214-1]